MNNRAFRDFARRAADVMGSHWSFIISLALCVVWAAAGPFFGYSDSWQLVINTGTTVLTFLAVFLIQNTANRAALATELKLDELIRAVDAARNRFVNLEEWSDEQLEALQREFKQLEQREKRKGRATDAKRPPRAE
jgi:low affinity Fe/Cu permease